MSKFYRQVKGRCKKAATQCGNSEIEASVQSWEGSVTIRLYNNDDDKLCIETKYDEGSKFGGDVVYSGTVEGFLDKLRYT